MSESRLNAYYYAFDATDCEPIDRILSAVACAGKAYRHTESWSDAEPGEQSCVDHIQEAANEAARALLSLKSERATDDVIMEQHNMTIERLLATIEKQARVVEAARLLSDAMYVGVGECEGMRGLWCSTRNGPADHAALMIEMRSAIDAMADAEGGE